LLEGVIVIAPTISTELCKSVTVYNYVLQVPSGNIVVKQNPNFYISVLVTSITMSEEDKVVVAGEDGEDEAPAEEHENTAHFDPVVR
jgi:hypothetical protein